MSARKKAELPAAVREVLDELAAEAWSLKALIECANRAIDGTGQWNIDDSEAAMNGLGALAARLSTALDPDAFAVRVAELEADRIALGQEGHEPDPRKGLRVVKGAEPGEPPP